MAADSRDDPVDDVHKVFLAMEPGVGPLDQSLALNVDRGMSIDENVVHSVVIDERL